MFKFLKGKNLVIIGLMIFIGIVICSQSVTAIGAKLVEDYLSIIKFNQGYFSAFPIQTSSTITGAGIVNSGSSAISSTLSVGGSSTLAAVSTSGLITANAGINQSYANSTTTTATTYTLVEADILNYTSVLMTPNTGTLTITMMASSSATNMFPTAGDRGNQCWFNATTTTGILITFASSSSFDIGTSSPSGLSIKAGEWGCFDFAREPVTASTFDLGAVLDVGSE